MFSQAELSKYAEIFQAQGQVNGFLPGKYAIASLCPSPVSHHVPHFHHPQVRRQGPCS
jgi:hypothetical protein